MWFNITQPTNNNPKPYTIVNGTRSYVIFPVFNSIWYVRYAFGQEVTEFGSTEYIYIVLSVHLLLNGVLLMKLLQMI